MKTNKISPSLKRRLAIGFIRAMKKASKVRMSKRRHAIRGAAYACMASAVGPRKAWSRAILRSIGGTDRGRNVDGRSPVSDELRDLSEMVPDGATMDACKLLSEAAHYIKILRTQVQIMRNVLHASQL